MGKKLQSWKYHATALSVALFYLFCWLMSIEWTWFRVATWFVTLCALVISIVVAIASWMKAIEKWYDEEDDNGG